MTRVTAILFTLLLALSGCTTIPTDGSYDGSAHGRITAFDTGPIRLRHLDSVNALRSERGMQPLEMSAQLIAAAATHARDMAAQERAWDYGSDRSSPQARATRAGYPGIVRGENVAETFKGEFFVLQAWLGDTASRAVMLDAQSTHMGFAWFQEPNGKLWWVQVIGQIQAPEPLLTAQLQ